MNIFSTSYFRSFTATGLPWGQYRTAPDCTCRTRLRPDALVDAIQDCFPAGAPAEAGSLLTNARQESAVRRSLEAVRRALSALDSGLTPDAVLTDAEEALESIGELTGRTAKEEIVGAVFSRFCVGK